MRILISLNTIGVGGAEIFGLKLAQELSKKHTVFLCEREPEGRHEDVAQKFAPDVKVLSKLIAQPFRFFIKSFGWILKRLNFKTDFYLYIKGIYLRSKIRKNKIQLVSSHTLHSDYFICKSLLKNNIPVVITMHGCYESSQGLRFSDHVNLVMQRTNAIIYLTDKNLSRIKNLQAIKEKILVKKIYNGHPVVETNYKITRKEFSISENAIVFIMVARGIPEKGWEIAIDAFKKLQNDFDSNVYLLLVGDSVYVQQLKQQEQSNLQIIFTGYSLDPVEEISISDIGILVSYSESLPNSVVEYLLCGKPVIASEVGEIPLMIEDEKKKKAGYIIPLDANGKPSVELLYKYMLAYVKNPELITTHSDIAKEAAMKFDMKTCIEKYEELFSQIIE